MINESRPISNLVNTLKIGIAETWATITTTWASETRTWDDLSLINNDSRISSSISNIARPV